MTSHAPTSESHDRIKRLRELDRTQLPADGGPGLNRLVFATSPYLLQHAENPVDWYPWGEAAFAKARAEDKPVLVSIGYATCHWCHVMAHESFEDPEVAAALNRNCVAIKVDREERPDLDELYMRAAQLLNGGGGWPLNVVMTPDQHPFFAATYLPAHSRSGSPGLIELIERIGELWKSDRARILESCASITANLTRISAPESAELAGEALLERAYRQIATLYDAELGGFGRAPKFPMPVYLTFLLHHHRRSGTSSALEMVEQTLRKMRSGGIYDQLGFGFHRYSVDRQWLVPHFEKMLYDQALLACVALETYQTTGAKEYRQLAAEIFACVLREFTAPEGGFYSALDADSEGAEGTYYLWTPEELRARLGEQPGNLAGALFDVTTRGNFEGKNILHLPLTLSQFALKHGILPEQLADDLEHWRQELLAARARRIPPFRDEKLLTGWNGLMIAALARGYAATGESAWREAAEAAVRIIRQRLFTAEGRLLRSFHAGAASIPGFLEDYAFYLWGLFELHQATLAEEYLSEAVDLSRELLRLFQAENGGLYDVGSDAEQLLVRMQSATDGVIPSGTSITAWMLLRLGRCVDDAVLSAAGEALLRAHLGSVARQPTAYLFLLCALDFAVSAPLELTLSGGSAAEREIILRGIGKRFLPGLVVRSDGKTGPLQIQLCAESTCLPAVADLSGLERLLDQVRDRSGAG